LTGGEGKRIIPISPETVGQRTPTGEVKMTNAEQAFASNTVTTLSAEYAEKALRGAEIKAEISKLKKELEPIDAIFKGLHAKTGQRTFLRPNGEVAVTVDHGERHILDQPALKLAKPEVVAAFQTLSEWDVPNYKKG